ncbi:hypothetical protein C8J57DRAFT_1196745 [Mycena rebaudengoi]|nr:hypothetical protein C8J57DRAFT_1196745 [Mycena rebaudengoi]
MASDADADKIKLLRLYLENLPDDLPYSDIAGDASINKLLDFGDGTVTDWIEPDDEVASVVYEIRASMKDFGDPDAEGIYKITTRGSALETLADILDTWLRKHPDDLRLQDWLKIGIASASAAILAQGEPLPLIPLLEPQPDIYSVNPKPKKGMQTTLGGGIAVVKQKKPKKKKTLKAENPDDQPAASKPDTKILADTSDPRYDCASEAEDDRTGGQKMSPLLLRISVACRPVGKPEEKKLVRCLASAGCRMTWAWPRSKKRILKHAMSCSFLAGIDGGSLVTQAIAELAKKTPHSFHGLTKNWGLFHRNARHRSLPRLRPSRASKPR